jgi:hypothetical protein
MVEFWNGIQLRLQEIFDPTALGARLAEWAADLIVALIVLAGFYFAWRALDRVLQGVLRRRSVDQTLATLWTCC